MELTLFFLINIFLHFLFIRKIWMEGEQNEPPSLGTYICYIGGGEEIGMKLDERHPQ